MRTGRNKQCNVKSTERLGHRWQTRDEDVEKAHLSLSYSRSLQEGPASLVDFLREAEAGRAVAGRGLGIGMARGAERGYTIEGRAHKQGKHESGSAFAAGARTQDGATATSESSLGVAHREAAT